MTQYSSIRIYLASGSIITGFFDVIGYYGAELTPTNGVYTIDCINQKPVVQKGATYYYLDYTESGFLAGTIDSSDAQLHLLQDGTQIPVYRDVWIEGESDSEAAKIPEDTASTLEYPIIANITISGIGSKYAAYREYVLLNYTTYGLQKLKEIHDNYGLIDEKTTDLVLTQLNNDNIEVDPADGSYNDSLEKFVLTFPYTGSINSDYTNGIKLYDSITQAIIAYVPRSNVIASGKKVTLILSSKVTASGAYYLYIPLGFFNYVGWEGHTSSSLTMFLFRVLAAEDESQKYVYSPTVGKSLSEITITFPNITKIYGYEYYSNITVTKDGTTLETSYSKDRLSTTNSANALLLRLSNTYTSPGSYVITIPAGTITPQQNMAMSEDMVLNYTVVADDSGYKLSHGIKIDFNPTPNLEYYSISTIKALITVPNSYENVSIDNIAASFDSTKIVKLEHTDKDGKVTSANISYTAFSTKTELSDSTIYTYDIYLGGVKNSPTKYTLQLPANYFTITYDYGDETLTEFSTALEPVFLIKSVTDETESSGSTKTFCRGLIGIVSTSESYTDAVAFRNSDTIFVNNAIFSQIQTTPCLSLTTHKDDGSVDEISIVKEEGETITTQLKIEYTTADGVTALQSFDLKYNKTYNVLSELLKTQSSYPQRMRFDYMFSYQGQTMEYSIEVQILSPAVYYIFNQNVSAYRESLIDIYSGKTYVTRWGCLEITDDYDDILQLNFGTEEAPDKHNLAELIPTCRTRTGNLGGIYNETFGTKQPKGYGLYGENVYLTGNFFLDNGKSLVDISDNLLLAVGDTKKIKKDLNTLSDNFTANINFIKNDQAALKAGLNATIKNYISTNKNAVLKIGLDYSLWALGNAGITLVNPNATYTYDKVTGNYNVDESTVGDGDEYVALQGNSIYFNINKSVGDYYAVVCTTTNPNLWTYKSSIFVPYDDDTQVKFFLGYLRKSAIASLSNPKQIQGSKTNKEFLKYVGLPSTLESPDSGSNTGITPGIDTNTQAYAFNPYYVNTKTNNDENDILYLDSSGNYTNYYSLNQDVETVYFVKKVDTVGLFDSTGKFNTNLIQTNSILAIGEGYTLNSNFNQDEAVSSSNYPVVGSDGETPDYTAPYVIISGKLGLLSANRANLSGSLKVGNYYSDDGQYIFLTDNASDDDKLITGNDTNAGLYFIHRDSGQDVITSKFNGEFMNDPLTLINPTTGLTFSSNCSCTDAATANFALTYFTRTEDSEDLYYNMGDLSDYESHTGAVSQGKMPSVKFFTYGVTDNIAYSDGSTVTTETPFIVKNNSNTFTLSKGEQVSLRFSGTVDVSVGISQVNYFNVNATKSTYIKIVDDNNRTWVTKRISVTALLYYEIDYYLNWDGNTYNIMQSTRTYSNKRSNTSSQAYSYTINLSNTTTDTQEYSVYVVTETTYSCSANIQDYCYVLSNRFTGTGRKGDPYYKDGTERSVDGYADNWSQYGLAEIQGVTGSVKYTGFSITVLPSHFTSNFLGNGVLFGFNTENYFTAFCKSNTTSYSYNDAGNTVTIQYASNGYGQMYRSDKYRELVAGKEMPKYFPILKGEVCCTSENNEYTFKGYAISSSASNCSASSSTQTSRQIKNYPFINYNGVVDTTDSNIGKSFSTSNPVYYTETSGIYFIRAGEGKIIIAFADKSWAKIADNNGRFCNDLLRLQIHLVGRGTWDSSNKTLKSLSYATLKGVSGITNTVTATIVSASDTSTSIENVNFSNFIRVDISDDETNNDGGFLIDIGYCPN